MGLLPDEAPPPVHAPPSHPHTRRPSSSSPGCSNAEAGQAASAPYPGLPNQVCQDRILGHQQQGGALWAHQGLQLQQSRTCTPHVGCGDGAWDGSVGSRAQSPACSLQARPAYLG